MIAIIHLQTLCHFCFC